LNKKPAEDIDYLFGISAAFIIQAKCLIIYQLQISITLLPDQL